MLVLAAPTMIECPNLKAWDNHVKLLSTTECQRVAGGGLSSDPWIVIAGIVGMVLFVYGFF